MNIKFIPPLYFFLTTGILLGQPHYTSNWTKDGIIVTSGALMAFSAFTIDRSFSELTPQEINELSIKSINWFDRGAVYNFSEEIGKASDLLAGATISAPFIFLVDNKMREDWKTISLMYFETMIFSFSIPSIGKGSIKRVRPYAYNPDVPFEKKATSEAKRSFFSRHTTIAFSSAVFFSTIYDEYYPDSKWHTLIWTSTLVSAGTVGYLRYNSGEHFPTDIITGAIIGSAIGYLLPYLHKKENKDVNISIATTILPVGIQAQLKF